MISSAVKKLSVAASTLAIWALAAGGAVYWGLKISAQSPMASAIPVEQNTPATIDATAVARMLGAVTPESVAPQAAPPMASRFVLTGVAAVSASGERGVALIAMDGKPPKPYRVGAVLEDGVLLQSVQTRSATLAASLSGPATAVLDLPIKK